MSDAERRAQPVAKQQKPPNPPNPSPLPVASRDPLALPDVRGSAGGSRTRPRADARISP